VIAFSILELWGFVWDLELGIWDFARHNLDDNEKEHIL